MLYLINVIQSQTQLKDSKFILSNYNMLLNGKQISIPKYLFEMIIPYSFITYTLVILLNCDHGSARIVSFRMPYIALPTEPQIGTIFFLPGHGQRGAQWSSAMERIREPYLKIICPTANVYNVSFHDGIDVPSWYDFYENPETGLPLLREDAQGINVSTGYIQHLIKDEIKRGIPPHNIIVSGYGHGGPLALHVALTFPQRLGGVVLFSTFTPMNNTFTTFFNKVNKNLPILQCYHDKAIWVTEKQNNVTTEMLQSVSFNTFYRKYPGDYGQPYIIPRELKDMRIFVRNLIPKPT